MNSTRGTKGKYGLKDKKEMVWGRRIYGQKRGRQHTCFFSY